MIKRLAIFKDVKYGYNAYAESGLDLSTDYVRLSEYVDVDFPMLPPEETVSKEIEMLDKLSCSVRAKYHDDIAEIYRKKAELIALPAPESE